jgi:hypothetical protein
MRALLFIATFAASCSPHPVDANKAEKSEVVEKSPAADKLPGSGSDLVETSPAAVNIPSADQARRDAAAYSRRFSVEPMAGGGVPELRIWTEEYVFGGVSGYVARPGRLSIYQAPSRGPVRRRTIATPVADDLIRMIPDLRGVRFEHCEPVLDGGVVIVEGRDAGGGFAFEIENHEHCEGRNVGALDRALRLADSANIPE